MLNMVRGGTTSTWEGVATPEPATDRERLLSRMCVHSPMRLWKSLQDEAETEVQEVQRGARQEMFAALPNLVAHCAGTCAGTCGKTKRGSFSRSCLTPVVYLDR